MFRKTMQLLDNEKACQALGEQAYDTIMGKWNYCVAAERMVEFIKHRTIMYTDGPLSKGK